MFVAYFRPMKKSTTTSKELKDKSSFKHFEGILKGKGDVLKALLKEKMFEKAHDEERYVQLFNKQK